MEHNVELGVSSDSNDAEFIAKMTHEVELQHLGIDVEEDYLRREARENREMMGFSRRLEYGEEEIKGRTEFESAVWKHHMQLKELHDERIKACDIASGSHLESAFDEDLYGNIDVALLHSMDMAEFYAPNLDASGRAYRRDLNWNIRDFRFEGKARFELYQADSSSLTCVKIHLGPNLNHVILVGVDPRDQRIRIETSIHKFQLNPYPKAVLKPQAIVPCVSDAVKPQLGLPVIGRDGKVSLGFADKKISDFVIEGSFRFEPFKVKATQDNGLRIWLGSTLDHLMIAGRSKNGSGIYLLTSFSEYQKETYVAPKQQTEQEHMNALLSNGNL